MLRLMLFKPMAALKTAAARVAILTRGNIFAPPTPNLRKRATAALLHFHWHFSIFRPIPTPQLYRRLSSAAGDNGRFFRPIRMRYQTHSENSFALPQIDGFLLANRKTFCERTKRVFVHESRFFASVRSRFCEHNSSETAECRDISGRSAEDAPESRHLSDRCNDDMKSVNWQRWQHCWLPTV
jgi:hypothetical protein